MEFVYPANSGHRSLYRLNTGVTEIKQAIEAIFDVKVASVNTQNRQGKTRRTRTGTGKSKDTKRAIVTLREGTIDIFGDVAK
ncbi:MAG: 50S ribosomal protein L23 [Actinomyces sp.]